MSSSLKPDEYADKKEAQDSSVPSLPKTKGGPVTDRDSGFERRTLRSVDLHLLPVFGLLYSFALIDRINLGAARTAGMGPALQLQIGARFSIATVMYFVPYILLQIPGNLVIRKVGARNWLFFCTICWGAVQLGMGYVRTWSQLVWCRVLLGIFEASFFPSIVYLISSWYTRYEVQKRLAGLYMLSVTISGFSPILAYGLSLLNGKRHIAGWSWIFIIEGAITLFLGVGSFFLLPDFPEKNKFLTPDQTALILERVEDDRGDSVPEEITFRKVMSHLGDWTLWAYGLMFMCCTLPAYALAYFISIILKGMGWSTTNALLLSAPPYAPAFLSALFFAWLADKYRHRAGFIAIQALISITGLCLTAFSKHNNVRYFGIFLLNAGSSGCIPGILAYSANNVVGSSKRSVSSALTVAFGGVGGIIASTVYREKDFPRYLPGLWVTLGGQFLLLSLVGATTLHFMRLNKRARTEGVVLEGRAGFFYTL
ncbi:major facilitator superfamily domain-containing protein [Mycena rebaudengoi]|nr:major facilitator superfamily domain-containing protein [Mycena rebaudengoi]